MNILVVGATGGTGREIVRQSLEHGHRVTAFVRNPARLGMAHDHLTVAGGDVLDPASLDRAMPGQDAVLCALGHKRWFIRTTILSDGTANIIDSMKRHGVTRLVCETSLGVGDSRGKMGLYYTLFVIPVIVWFYFRDKERQEEYIKKTDLDWVVVRPGRLTNGRKRGQHRHGPGVGSWILTPSISRADTAAFMLKQLIDSTYLRKTPGISY